eukprot:356484-Chlamydomonas_euryale.AAC.1
MGPIPQSFRALRRICGTCTQQRPSGLARAPLDLSRGRHCTAHGVAEDSSAAVASRNHDREDSRVYGGLLDLLVRLRMLVAAGRTRERESNASLTPCVAPDARLESWEHSESGRGLSQRSNALQVRKATS